MYIKKQKVGLMFMPHFNISHLYLSLPVLSAYLNEYKIENVQLDWNIESIHYFMSEKFIETASQKYLAKVSDQYLRMKHNLIKKHLLDQKTVFDKAIGDTENFFEEYSGIKRLLNLLYDYINMSYSPMEISFDALSFGDSGSFKEIEYTISAKHLNPYIEFFQDQIALNKLESLSVVAISLSCYSQIIPTLTFCKIVRELYPNIKVCIGGNVFTKIKYKIEEHHKIFEWVDYVLLHEGEETLVQLIECIDMGKSVDHISNLVYMSPAGIVNNSTSNPPVKIESLPVPNYAGLREYKYLSPVRILPYYISRSCYWGKCTFCDHDYGYDGYYRTKSIGKIINELKHINEKYPDSIVFFVDEAIPYQVMCKLSEAIIDEGLTLKWFAYIKADKRYSETVCESIKLAGCCYLMMGVESCSDKLLKLMRKGINKEDILTTIKNMEQVGIWLHTFLIHDFPSEDYKDILETLLILKNNNFHSVGISQFVLTKNSKIAQSKQENLELYTEKAFSSVLKPNSVSNSSGSIYGKIAKLYNDNKYNQLAIDFLMDFQHIPVFNSRLELIGNPLLMMNLLNERFKISFSNLLYQTDEDDTFVYSLSTGKMILIEREHFDFIKSFEGTTIMALPDKLKDKKLNDEEYLGYLSLATILFLSEDQYETLK